MSATCQRALSDKWHLVMRQPMTWDGVVRRLHWRVVCWQSEWYNYRSQMSHFMILLSIWTHASAHNHQLSIHNSWSTQFCQAMSSYSLRYKSSVLWLCWLGDRKVIWAVKSWVLVCWWWWFDWSFARLIAPVVQLSPPSLLAPVKCRMETFWFHLTQVHREKRPLKRRESK